MYENLRQFLKKCIPRFQRKMGMRRMDGMMATDSVTTSSSPQELRHSSQIQFPEGHFLICYTLACGDNHNQYKKSELVFDGL